MKTFSLPILLLLLPMSLFAQIDLRLELITDTFTQVVDIAHAGDDRLFIVEKAGRIWILHANETVNPRPFLDIDLLVTAGGGTAETGLLGLVFHPDYAENGYFFINYTTGGGGDPLRTVVARYQVSGDDPDLADPASGTIILPVDQPYTNNNGGDLNFGPDGYLYISSGDGGSSGDPDDNGQNLETPLGKMLRINVDQGPGSLPEIAGGAGYRIPPDNPFADGLGGAIDEIWALGLRNPWRFSFDRITRDMWIGDVGQTRLEEINLEPAWLDPPEWSAGGLNYGWRCYEGNSTYNTTDCQTANAYTGPIYTYNRDLGCAVIGGYVYRGTDYPSLYGLYFYTDFCSGRIWSLKNEAGDWVNEELLQQTGGNFVTFGEDYRGELYLGSLDGSVYRLIDAACKENLDIDDSSIPAGTYQARALLTSRGTVESGTNVTFRAAGSILLEPGFQAQVGSIFCAMIGGCGPFEQ